MKNTIILFLLLGGFNTSAFAQLETGRAFVGGGLSASFPVSGTSKTSRITLSPEYGVVKKPNQIVGLSATFGLGSTKTNNSPNKENSFTVGVSPFVQQVFPLSKRFFVTITGTAGLSLTTTNRVQTSLETKNTAVELALTGRPGVMYLLQKRWLLRLDVGNARILSFQQANTTETRTNQETKTNTFNYDFRTLYGFSGTQIGLYYFFK